MADFANIRLEFVKPDGDYDVGDRVAVKATLTDDEGAAVDLASTTIEGKFQYDEDDPVSFTLTKSGNVARGSFLASKSGTYYVRVQASGAYEGAEEQDTWVESTMIPAWTSGGVSALLMESGDALLTESGDTLVLE